MYIDFDYKGSTAYNSVMGASRQGLLNRLPYTKNAIKYHIENNNPGQVKFFTEELELINKRLNIKKEDMIRIFKEIEEEINSPEYIEKSRIIETQCEEIKKMPLNTKKDILRAKNASRPIPYSPEKILLFKYLITIENSLTE